MSWFPSFLTPLTGLIAAAVVIPSLLVLYFLKLRRREVEFASTILWKKSIQDLQVNAPFQKLRRNLLLLLQLILLLLLTLALARPISHYTPGAGRSTVILIDRSASMLARDVEGKTRLEAAKTRARDLIDTMDRDATAMVIAFDEDARIVQTFTSDRPALKRSIDSIVPSHRPSRLKLAYQLAEAQVAFIPEQNRTNVEPPEVWVFSDGRVSDAADLKIMSPVKFVQIGSDQAANIAITSLSARRNYDRPTEVQVFASLMNFGPEPVTAQIQLSIATIDPADPARTTFAVGRMAEVSLLPERWTDQQRDEAQEKGLLARNSAEFTIDLSTAAVIKIEQMNKNGDLLVADDAAMVVVPPPKALSLLLVTQGNYYLERALASLGVKDPKQMTPGEYEAQQPADFDVVMFDNYSPEKLPSSGNFLHFGSVPAGLAVTTEAGPDGEPVRIEEATVLDWQRDHPILRHLQLGKVYAARQLKLNVPPETPTLLDGMKGPMIVLHREGRSTHLIVGFDLLESNWPLRQSFPVFLQQAMQYLAIGSDLTVRESFKPGASAVLPRTNLGRAPGGEPKRIRLFGPDGDQTIDVPPSGDFALPAFEKVGLYQTEPIIPQFERIAVNLLDAGESNLMPEKAVPGGSGETIAAAGQKRRLDLWWWIVAVVALPLLMIEWWVYTRRVHL